MPPPEHEDDDNAVTGSTSSENGAGNTSLSLAIVSNHSSPGPMSISSGGSGSNHLVMHGPGPGSEYSQDTPDTKEGLDELCPVCGDKVSGYHYGLLTCESCKGFFKRTVQNKKVYTCVGDRNCHIDKSQRKRCPFCRFQKCRDVGMKLEAVRADRMRGGRNKFGPMYKRDRARRLQMMRQRQMIRGIPEPGPMHGSPFMPNGMAGSQTSLYSGNGIKQELIQIPQLSSSTSSPDSSPLPGQNVAHANASSSSSSGNGPNGAPFSAGPSGGAHYGQSSGSKLMQPASGPYHLVGNPMGPNHLPPIEPCGPGKVPYVMRELQITAPDEKDWQNQLFTLLNSQSYNQCEVDLFELMCKVIDQSLFAQVDWARNSIFFKDLKVDDQMKLLQNSWSDLLVLDHMHQRMHLGLPDETTLANGQKFDLLSLALLGIPAVSESLEQVQANLFELKLDGLEYLCVKFLLLMNPEVKGLSNYKLVHDAHERTQQALQEYTTNNYPQIPDKFNQLIGQLPQLRLLTMRGEEFLYFKHLSGSAPTQTLLMEMLHAKRK